MLRSSCLQSDGFEGLGFRRKVTPPDAPSVAPPARLPPGLHDGRVAGIAVCPTPDARERHVLEVTHFLDFGGVVREGSEEIAPPPAHPLVAAVVALHGAETRLDLDRIVHEGEHRIEVTAVEGLIREADQIYVFARHPPAQYRALQRSRRAEFYLLTPAREGAGDHDEVTLRDRASPGRWAPFASISRSSGYRACRTGTPLLSRVRAARYSETMARDKVEVARRVTDAFNRRDVDGAFAELVTPDFEWYPAVVRALAGGGYRGREG